MATTPRKAAPRKSASAAPASVTSVSDWKKTDAPMELPSGKYMKVRKSSFRVFLKSGIIPNELMSVVQSALAKGQEPDMSAFSADQDRINQMMDMVDNVVIFCVVEPKVYPAPDLVQDSDTEEWTDPNRRDDRLYVDEIDEEDKMFIYQWVTGGTSDLEQFRRELAEQLASVQPREGLEGATQ